MSHLDFQTFTLSRDYGAPPARVFEAWAQPDQKRRWFADTDVHEAVVTLGWEMDFRPGGSEVGRFDFGGTVVIYRGLYHVIEAPGRILYTYTMASEAGIFSLSQVGVQLAPKDDCCRLDYTEQVVFLDGRDRLENRFGGTRDLLDALGAELPEP